MRAYEEKLDALGDPTRRRLLELLGTGPRSVGDLAEQFSISRPAISQHLRVLKDAGLVSDRRDGTRRLYEIRSAGVAEIRAYFDSLWDRALEAFRTAAEDAGNSAGSKGRRSGGGRRR